MVEMICENCGKEIVKATDEGFVHPNEVGRRYRCDLVSSDYWSKQDPKERATPINAESLIDLYYGSRSR